MIFPLLIITNMNFEIFQDEWITTSWDDEYSNPIIFPSTLR